jgi:hypothetical protein
MIDGLGFLLWIGTKDQISNMGFLNSFFLDFGCERLMNRIGPGIVFVLLQNDEGLLLLFF